MFESKWNTIAEYALDSKYGAAASFVYDGRIRAVGEGEVIISFNYESMVNRGLNLVETVQKLFKKVYNKDYDIAFITNDEWDLRKNEFIENKNNGIIYEYKEIAKQEKKETQKKVNNNDIKSQAIDLFGDDVISVN